uniref:Agenet domain-containing protein n=2 Tax=Kalanchoe fedtschenkoi TaxID=63787 RepID=A0A7N0T7A1_KALFE
MKHHNLPFEVGQMVEARSFLSGYRGSWFRCKVQEISSKKGFIGCILEYIDFPDESIKWTKLYQKPPISKSRMKGVNRELVVRPCYPPIYREDEFHDSRKILEAAVIVGNDWMVGDFVDWWSDDVYWCGEVIQVLGGDKAKIKLPDPPDGEGLTYEVHFKDLRPTLFWSPNQGWTVPINQVGGSCHYCARLIQPSVRGEKSTLEGKNDAQMSTYASVSSLASPSSLPPLHTSHCNPANPLQNQKLTKRHSVEACHEEHASVGLDNFATTSHSDSIANSVLRVTLGDMLKADRTEIKDEGSRKRIKTGGEINCNFKCLDAIEASALELEELACKIRWLKMVISHGSPMLNTQPSWKFVKNRATAVPKT